MLSIAQLFLVLCLARIADANSLNYGDVGSRYDLPDYSLNDDWLKALVEKISSDYESPEDYLSAPNKQNNAERRPQLTGQDLFAGRVTKDENAKLGFGFGDSPFSGHAKEPTIRDHEYLQHSTLWGNQFVAGGAGEGIQHLRPDGSMKNTHEVKTNPVLPAYCNPPNPCPIGFTEADGCITEFRNTASFSREFQSSQECMCDSEHMFDCPAPSGGSMEQSHHGGASQAHNQEKQIDTLAQSITNEGINQDNIDQLLKQVEGKQGNTVSKKKFAPFEKSPNPFLTGDKLPVQAKKSPQVYWE